jgi:pimeloyl-ACP methyl ester carboxylesterase
VQQRPDLFGLWASAGGERPPNEEISYQFVLEEARHAATAKRWRARAIHPPQLSSSGAASLAQHLRGQHLRHGARPQCCRCAVRAQYTLATLAFFGCFRRTIERLWEGLDGFDAIAQIPRIEVPVFLFTGRHDWNTPFPLIEEWAARLEAPHVEIVWFDEAGHMPPLGPRRVQRALIEIRPSHGADGARNARSPARALRAASARRGQ